jgi:glycosyltransferase involved in cell wall biosynthesis
MPTSQLPAGSSRPSGGFPEVVMLLDNHYGPDPRVAFEAELLHEAGIHTRIIAWDRRLEGEADDPRVLHHKIIRIAVPAPRGGGRRSLLAVARFGIRVWRRRRQLLGASSLLIVHDIYLLPLGWLLAHRLRMPFIYDAHEDYARMEADRYPNWALQLVTALESRLARSALAVIVPGASRVTRWCGILRRPPIVLPNLVQRDQAPRELEPVEWDLLSAGTLSQGRRLDLLVELARLRPDLRIAIAGRGRSAADVARAASELPNLTYLGWSPEVEALFRRTKAIYYGLDPEHPYSDVACPNTLYQALVHRKPLIFFCGGEPARLASEFEIGIRCEPSVPAVSAAIDRASTVSEWEFDEAWRAVWDRAGTDDFVEAVTTGLRQAG